MDDTEISTMDQATLALVKALAEQEYQPVGKTAADLIVWFVDTRIDLLEALRQEREGAARLAVQLDEAVARLNRLGDHLRTLTVYAEGDDDHAAPSDPFPANAP